MRIFKTRSLAAEACAKGNIKIKGLLIVYFSSFLVWKKENNKSLEKTMTSLDLYLRILQFPNYYYFSSLILFKKTFINKVGSINLF